jgi:Fe-S cluster biogenesis protein NfuA
MNRLEALIHAAEGFTDPVAQSATREIVGLLLDIHGAGLAKILELVGRTGATGRTILEACSADSLVASLFLLHNLHPLDLTTRVQQALQKVRPYLCSHGGNVELVSIDDGVVRLRMSGSCQSCPSSTMTLQTTIEEAILATAPDVARVEVHLAEETAGSTEKIRTTVSLPMVRS